MIYASGWTQFELPRWKKILVEVAPVDLMRKLAALPTAELIELANEGNYLAKATLWRYRRRRYGSGAN